MRRLSLFGFAFLVFSAQSALARDAVQPLFPGMLGEEVIVSPPPPDEWRTRMPRGYQHRALPANSVRALYLIPSNRTAMPNAVDRFRQTITMARDFYADQMERNGFGPRTFNYETEADGVTPKVYVVNGPNTDDYYRVDPWSRVSSAAQAAGYPVWSPGQVWWIIYEAHVQNSDGTVTGGFNGGASNGSGSDAGVGMTVAWTMAYLTPQLLIDDRAYDGLIVPEVGPYPLKYGVTHASFDGNTLSALSSVAHGIVLHEGSHGFNLWHDFRNDSNFAGNLLGNGFRGVRGWARPDRYPADGTRLDYGCALALTASRYFNPGTVWTDNTKPTVALSATGSVAVQAGLLPVRFTASDAGGLHSALLRVDGNTVEETPLSGTTADFTFRTPWYTPGTAHSVAVTVLDQQGNKQDASGTITPASSGNRAPQPFISVEPKSVALNSPFTLSAANTTDPDHSAATLTVEWDLDGNGTFDTAPTTNKTLATTFATPGCRLIRARFTDPAGAVSISAPVTVRVTGTLSAVSPQDWLLYD